MKSLRNAILGLCALGACGTAAAGYIELTIPTYTFSLQSLTNGGFYPASGPLSVGGVPFNIAQDANGNNMWEAEVGFSDSTGPNPLVIPVNLFDVKTAYTLMDSFFGSCGTTIGTVRFLGSAGADVTFNLIEGDNIRDHLVGGFCNDIAAGTPSMDFGGDVHLDMQTYVLPAEFHTQTLTSIIITSLRQGFEGEPFITSATVLVPEPATLALVALGLAGFGFARRKQT